MAVNMIIQDLVSDLGEVGDARKIGPSGDIPADAVTYTAQTGKTDNEKTQARQNIDAMSASHAEFENMITIQGETAGGTADAIIMELDSTTGKSILNFEGEQSQGVVLSGLAAPSGGTDAANKSYVDGNHVTDLESTSITITAAAANTIYEYGELTSLTISSIPTSGSFIVSWRSGSTTTVHNLPTTMRFPTADNTMEACDANTDYEIDCRNGKCVVTAWPVVSP